MTKVQIIWILLVQVLGRQEALSQQSERHLANPAQGCLLLQTSTEGGTGRRRGSDATLPGVNSVKGSSVLLARAVVDQASALRRTPKDASFFDPSFSQGESTFDPDGENSAQEVNILGQDEVSTLATIPTAVPANWFPETESAGAKQAWQTYSENPQEIHSWSSEWQTAQDGSLEQPSSQGGSDLSYLDDLAHMEPAKGADWFENEVIQYDEYGRPRAPTDRSDKYYVEWNRTEKSVALKCAAPGCTANASLQVFGNTSANEYTMCRMSFMVYATDFDDQYSRERIEWLVVNGREVLRDFTPMAKGCGHVVNRVSLLSISNGTGNASASGPPLYPCFQDMAIEEVLIGTDGQLNISGKITDLVDECPLDGNHFSGIVNVSCFTRPRPQLPMNPEKTTTTTASVDDETIDNATAHFRCEEPGCSARAVLIIDAFANGSKTCKLTVRISQTDFDGDTEQVEWVKVGANTTLKSGLKPGKNPCTEAEAAGQTKANASNFTLVDAKDVTEMASLGKVTVRVKISDAVDECGIQGRYLLDGVAELVCSSQ
eukprot:CAMPEP_0115089130 /NCGR_PEP_ID=MMETSP0227-20121206/24464_1 /TAXON_ID=89957 /ORGANISM="Polarella glacialis, Strain CCMP 1383" /LENGTH=544 /DNA_ID=CAMNT_0002479653 /DNA_START=101 /DNA_END=1735 /DNA_ORIENTATION=-